MDIENLLYGQLLDHVLEEVDSSWRHGTIVPRLKLGQAIWHYAPQQSLSFNVADAVPSPDGIHASVHCGDEVSWNTVTDYSTVTLDGSMSKALAIRW